MSVDIFSKENPFNKNSEPVQLHRLNDYDSNILESSAYREINDEMFKLEYKISEIEKEIETVTLALTAAKDVCDEAKVDILSMRKHKLELELVKLNKKYNECSIASKISGGISSINIPKGAETFFDKCAEFISSKILSKISKKFSCGQDLKDALLKLENINKSVDELISMKTPYGEAIDRYSQLTKYLNRANFIHYHISKMME